MLKIASLVFVGLVALWSAGDAQTSSNAQTSTSAPAPLALVKQQLPEHEFEPFAQPEEMPRVSNEDGAQSLCGFSYADGVPVPVGETYLSVAFPTQAAAIAWYAIAANRTALAIEFANAMTAHLPCGVCDSGAECSRHVSSAGGGFTGGVALDPVTGLWHAYIETTGLVTLYVTCLPCPI